MEITWTDEWVLRDTLIYKVRTYSNGAVSEEYAGSEELTRNEGEHIVSYRWNWETNTYDEVGREPNPNPPQPPGPSELEQLRQELAWLKRENTLLKAQVTASSNRQDFVEDLIAELAMMICP